jgi:CysZ protein
MFEFNCEDAYLPWLCSAVSAAAGLLQFFVKWFLHIAFIGLYLMIYKSILLILYSPVLAYLVDVLDKKHKGLNEPFRMEQFIRDTVRGIKLAVRGLFLEGGALFVLILLALIPIVNLIQPILLWFVSAYFLGVSMLDYTLEKRGMNVKESINYTKKNKSLAVGIGSVFQLIFLIPFLGWMIAPTYSVIAAYFAVDELGNVEN